MKQKPYTKPKISSKKITIQFFTRKDYYPSNDAEVILLAQGSGSGCILPQVKITLLGNTQVAISSIKEGDRILSYDKKADTFVENTVKKIAIHKDETPDYYVINNSLAITGNHLLLVDEKEWKMVRDLQVGDKLLGYPKKPEPIASIDIVKKNAPVVYNLELEKEPGNYIADGICIHW